MFLEIPHDFLILFVALRTSLNSLYQFMLYKMILKTCVRVQLTSAGSTVYLPDQPYPFALHICHQNQLNNLPHNRTRYFNKNNMENTKRHVKKNIKLTKRRIALKISSYWVCNQLQLILGQRLKS